MRQVYLGSLQTSVVGLGCMRIATLSVQQAEQLVETALELGINLFDHADIYGGGEAEALFGKVLQNKPQLREQMVLQSKCGIRKGFYDFSYEHLMDSVEGSLRRLHTDHLDSLLFHRPDVLADPEEFAKAVQNLKTQGKVRQFGVSNMNPAQIQLLESWSGEPMTADQLQLSLVHAGMVTSCINVNMQNREGTMHDGSVLPYCQRTGTVVQAWSPLQDRTIRACFLDHAAYPELNQALRELAGTYGVSTSAIALAWILRIPGKLQVITGSTDCGHLQDACDAAGLQLTREDWYGLYRACGYPLP